MKYTKVEVTTECMKNVLSALKNANNCPLINHKIVDEVSASLGEPMTYNEDELKAIEFFDNLDSYDDFLILSKDEDVEFMSSYLIKEMESNETANMFRKIIGEALNFKCRSVCDHIKFRICVLTRNCQEYPIDWYDPDNKNVASSKCGVLYKKDGNLQVITGKTAYYIMKNVLARVSQTDLQFI